MAMLNNPRLTPNVSHPRVQDGHAAATLQQLAGGGQTRLGDVSPKNVGITCAKEKSNM